MLTAFYVFDLFALFHVQIKHSRTVEQNVEALNVKKFDLEFEVSVYVDVIRHHWQDKFCISSFFSFFSFTANTEELEIRCTFCCLH